MTKNTALLTKATITIFIILFLALIPKQSRYWLCHEIPGKICINETFNPEYERMKENAEDKRKAHSEMWENVK